MELEPKMILEYGAYGVMLYLFIILIKFLLKDLRSDLSKMCDIVKQDTDNTKELKEVIGNHLTTSINKLGEKIDQLGEKIEKK